MSQTDMQVSFTNSYEDRAIRNLNSIRRRHPSLFAGGYKKVDGILYDSDYHKLLTDVSILAENIGESSVGQKREKGKAKLWFQVECSYGNGLSREKTQILELIAETYGFDYEIESIGNRTVINGHLA